MKINPVTAAVTAALGLVGVSGTAAAVSFEPWDAATAQTVLRLSGATAQDKGIPLLMRRICSVGTMTRVTGTIDSAILCEANGVDSAPIPAGNKVLLYKNSNGGSSRGVVPVSAQSTTLTFLNLASLTQAQYTTASICTLTTFASTVDFADYKEYACGTNVTSPTGIAPDAGVSDLEPDLLGGVNSAFGAVTSGPMLLFGAPVSKNFRDALQTAQQVTLGAGCIGSNTEACMPTLTKAQLSNIWSGGIFALSRLSDDSGTLIPVPTGSTNVSVCRRKAGSGTLASYQVYFLNDLCVKSNKAVKGLVTGVDGNTALPSVASRVNEYSATPQVIGCLNANHTAGKYAIGMSSMESVPGSAYLNTGLGPVDGDFDDDAGNWGYIKIDGYAPSLLNAAQTRYDFGFEVSFQTKAGLADAIPNYRKSLFDVVVATNSNPLVIKEVNAGFVQGGGTFQSGFLGRPSSGSSTLPSAFIQPGNLISKLTAGEVNGNPVNTWTRAASAVPNSCNPPFLSRETGMDR